MKNSKRKQILSEAFKSIMDSLDNAFNPQFSWTVESNPTLTPDEIWSINGYQEYLEKTNPEKDPSLIAKEIRAEIVDTTSIAKHEISCWPTKYTYQMILEAAEQYLPETHPQHSMLIDKLEELARERGLTLVEAK